MLEMASLSQEWDLWDDDGGNLIKNIFFIFPMEGLH